MKNISVIVIGVIGFLLIITADFLVWFNDYGTIMLLILMLGEIGGGLLFYGILRKSDAVQKRH